MSTRYLLVLVVLALLFVAVAPSPAARCQQHHQTDTQKTVAQPSPLPTAKAIPKPKVSAAPQANSTATQAKEWYCRIYDHVWPPLWGTFFPPIWSNWGLIIVAIWAAYIAVGTLRNIERQTKAAEQEVKHLEATLNLTKETSRRELRAYVDVLNVSIAGTEQVIIVTVLFNNSGRTRACNVLVHTNCYATEGYRTELPRDFKYPDVVRPISIPSVFSIAPNVPCPVQGSDVITLGEIMRARNRQATLYIYGHADYFDVFGEPVRHTPFCYEFMPESPTGAFRAYKEHNDPD